MQRCDLDLRVHVVRDHSLTDLDGDGAGSLSFGYIADRRADMSPRDQKPLLEKK